MRRGDYTETRAVRELSAAEEPGPAGLLDIIYCVSTHFSTQEVGLNTYSIHNIVELQSGIKIMSHIRMKFDCIATCCLYVLLMNKMLCE